jgi:hypothetical protein
LSATSSNQRTRRQIVEEARQASLEGRWDEAIAINRELIERDGRDTDAHNRLGRALLELRDYAGAYEAYSNALRSDPANLIARRNLNRLELLRQFESEGDIPGEPGTTSFPRTLVFIEEVGKTWVTELTNPSQAPRLASIYAGQQLTLEAQDGRLVVSLPSGERIGEIERKTGDRVIELMEGGNDYEVYALGLTPSSLRVILREVHRDLSQADRVSFPRQITETRAYLRERDLLRQRDEADFYLDDEEEEMDDRTSVKADDDADEDEVGDDEGGDGELEEEPANEIVDEEEDESEI